MAQTTQGVSVDDLGRLRSVMESSPKVDLHPIDLAVVDATTSIPRKALSDPWDRFILATARALAIALVTRDDKIRKTKLVETIW